MVCNGAVGLLVKRSEIIWVVYAAYDETVFKYGLRYNNIKILNI